jgi:hypothetical protein
MKSTWKWFAWPFLLGAWAATEAVYPKTVPVYDDRVLLTEHALIRGYEYGKLWVTSYWYGVESVTTRETLYRPVFMTVLTLFQGQLGFLRALSWVSHLLIGFLLWRALLSRSEVPPGFAFFFAAIFVFHPANVEVTAQHVGLQELAATLLGLSSIALARSHPWASAVLASIAPGWKEIGFVWLGGAGGALYCESKRKQAVAAASAGALWLWARWWVHGSVATFDREPYALLNPVVGMSAWDATWSKISLIGHHLRLVLFPYPLTSDYSAGTLMLPAAPYEFMVLIALAFLGVLVWRRDLLSTSAATALATVLPTLHLLTPIGTVFAERFGYGFRWGILYFVGALFARFDWRKYRWFIGPIAAATIFGFFALNLNRQRAWTSPYLLFQEDALHYPRNAKARYNLGTALFELKEFANAEAEFSAAVSLAPDFPDAHFWLAVASNKIGKTEQAQYHVRVAADLGYPHAKRLVDRAGP